MEDYNFYWQIAEEMRIIINTSYVPPPPFLPGFQLFTRAVLLPIGGQRPPLGYATASIYARPCECRVQKLTTTSNILHQYPLPYHHRTLKIGKMVLMSWFSDQPARCILLYSGLTGLHRVCAEPVSLSLIKHILHGRCNRCNERSSCHLSGFVRSTFS